MRDENVLALGGIVRHRRRRNPDRRYGFNKRCECFSISHPVSITTMNFSPPESGRPRVTAPGRDHLLAA
jgi:hypothetical protein